MKKESLKHQAYAIIKAKIINCEYPPNTFLNEGILKESINASRTPIREALSRLEQENLVKIIPKKGIMISELSINEITMIYTTRLLIEPFAILNYGANVSVTELEKMRHLFSSQYVPESMEDIYEIDDAFHALIVNATSNRYLIQSLEQTRAQNCRVRILSGTVDLRLDQSRPEHLYIVEAMLAKDFEKASRLMTEHLETSKNVAFSLLLNNGGWTTSNV